MAFITLSEFERISRAEKEDLISEREETLDELAKLTENIYGKFEPFTPERELQSKAEIIGRIIDKRIVATYREQYY